MTRLRAQGDRERVSFPRRSSPPRRLESGLAPESVDDIVARSGRGRRRGRHRRAVGRGAQGRRGSRSEQPSLDDVGPSASADLVRVYLREIGRVSLLTAADEVDLAKRVEAGVFAAERLGRDRARPEHRRRPAPRPARRRRRRAARQAAAHRGQPAAGRLDRQAVRRPRAAVPRPDPGGQPRADPRGREVRLHPRLQVLDVRVVVDPAGGVPRGRRPGPHHPHPGAHGRDRQPHPARAADARADPRPRPDARPRSPSRSTCRPSGSRRSSGSRWSRCRCTRRSARRRAPSSAT